jgi:hypothetical protein
MGWLILLLVTAICGLVFYLLWVSSEPDEGTDRQEPFSDEEIMQARLDLHRIERRVDLMLAKHDQRRHAEATKQAIAEALENDRR